MIQQGEWAAPDETASEYEMQVFLYALVRLLKPLLVVETGSYKGHTTAQLGLACLENTKGRVISCEPDALFFAEARERVVQVGEVARSPLPVEIRRCRSAEVPELAEANLIFSDSDYKFREEEIKRAGVGAVVVVHDTRISYDPTIPPLESLVRSMGGVAFQTYRGFGILIKG